jgi:hypothetical protein
VMVESIGICKTSCHEVMMINSFPMMHHVSNTIES